jgi:hypothetical protein
LVAPGWVGREAQLPYGVLWLSCRRETVAGACAADFHGGVAFGGADFGRFVSGSGDCAGEHLLLLLCGVVCLFEGQGVCVDLRDDRGTGD